MRKAILISGILGFLLLIIRVLGIFFKFSFNNIILISGLSLLLLVFIPLIITDKIHHNKKIDQIIKSYRFSDKNDIELKKEENNKIKGWSMNNSPFRERKSGLTWGGGNIKGANASRGKRREFLK